MLLIVVVIIILFGALFFVNNYKNKQVLENSDNPYKKDELRQETIDIMEDPLYQNIIVPDDLDKKLEDGESVTVYYFSPTCSYCQKATPIVVPIAEELHVDMKKMNLLEFDKMDYYELKGTPTLVHYEDGKEVGRVTGLPDDPEAGYRSFFEEYVVD